MGTPQRAVPARRRRALALAALATTLAACTSNPQASPLSDTRPPTQSASSSSPTSSPARSAIWHPKPRLTWQWQLTEPVDTSVNAQVYDIDGTENDGAVVARLHTAGRKVICYVNAGAYESFRPDASRFPAAVIGKSNGWPDERWLDIRQLRTLTPIMSARFRACARKGFDGVEADNVDGYQNDSGFPLSAADQLAYNRLLASLAHADGLAIGLKNDLDQVPQLLPAFDFSVDEQCAEYSECDRLKPFTDAGKAVFQVEYNLDLNQFCTETTALGLSSMRKNTKLDAARWPCPHEKPSG